MTAHRLECQIRIVCLHRTLNKTLLMPQHLWEGR